MELIDAFYLYRVGSRAADLCAAGVEEVGKVNDMRFSCRIFDDGHTLRLDGCKHDIHCSADGYNVKKDIVGFKTVFCNGFDITALNADLGSESFKALYVLVNRADTEIAPAGVADIRSSESAELRAEQII